MFNTQTIFNYIITRIGFNQTVDPCYPKIHPTLLASEKVSSARGGIGQFLQGEFIYNTGINYFDIGLRNNIAVWNNLVTYNQGDRVSFVIGSDTFLFVSRTNTNLG